MYSFQVTLPLDEIFLTKAEFCHVSLHTFPWERKIMSFIRCWAIYNNDIWFHYLQKLTLKHSRFISTWPLTRAWLPKWFRQQDAMRTTSVAVKVMTKSLHWPWYLSLRKIEIFREYLTRESNVPYYIFWNTTDCNLRSLITRENFHGSVCLWFLHLIVNYCGRVVLWPTFMIYESVKVHWLLLHISIFF